DDFDDDLDDDFDDDLDGEFNDAGDQHDPVVGTDADAAVAAATVHDLIERMRAAGIDGDATADQVASDDPIESAPTTAGDAAPTEEPAAPLVDSGTESGPMTDEALRDLRDAHFDPAARAVAKTLKRLVSDEQNELLDRLHRLRRSGQVAVDDLLGAADADVEQYLSGIEDELQGVAAAGAAFWSVLVSTEPPSSFVVDVRAAVAPLVAAALSVRRTRVASVLDPVASAEREVDEASQLLRATYRDWRNTQLASFADDVSTAAFAQGVQGAAGSGVPCRWVPDHGGLPCADADDNVLSGDVPCGRAFATGDLAPPAHPGCRCFLVPAT
ncbi:MAG: hypothetical protein ACKOYM_03360, partial [Actinomycetes bacterium]